VSSIKPASGRGQNLGVAARRVAPQILEPDDGLLPHERAAKKTLAKPPPSPPPPSDSEGLGHRRVAATPFGKAATTRRSPPDSRAHKLPSKDADGSKGHPSGFMSRPHPPGRHQHREPESRKDISRPGLDATQPGGWGHLKRRQDIGPGGEQKKRGGDGFWEKFKSQVSKTPGRSGPGTSTRATDATWDFLEQTDIPTRPPLQQEIAPGLLEEERPEKSIKQSKSRSRRAETFEDDAPSFERRDKKARSPREFDDRGSLRSSPNRRRSTLYEEDDEEMGEEALQKLEERRFAEG